MFRIWCLEFFIIIVDDYVAGAYIIYMDIKDKKIIEELLAKQVENLGQVIDNRLQEQSNHFDQVMDVRFEEQSENFSKVMDARLQEQSDTFSKVMDIRFKEQSENLNKVMDTRFQEQAKHFGQVIDTRFQEQAKHFGQVIDTRFKEQTKLTDTRFKEQSEILESRMINVFNEGVDQLILPHITRIEDDISSLKQNVSELNVRVGSLESGQERMERKLNSVVDRQDEQGIEIRKIKKFVKMPETV